MNGAAVSAEHTRQHCKVGPWFMLSFVIPWGTLMRLPRVKPGTGYCIPDLLSFSLAFQSCQGSPHRCVSLDNSPRHLYKKEDKPNKNPSLGVSPLSVHTATAPSHTEENTNAKGQWTHLLFIIIKILQLQNNNNNNKLKSKLCLFPTTGIFGEKKVRKPSCNPFPLSSGTALPKNLSALFHAYLACVQAQIPAPLLAAIFPLFIISCESTGVLKGEEAGSWLPALAVPHPVGGEAPKPGLIYWNSRRLRGTLFCRGHDNTAPFEPKTITGGWHGR